MRKLRNAALTATILLIGVAIGHNTNIYAGQNIGVTWGNCGMEVVGGHRHLL